MLAAGSLTIEPDMARVFAAPALALLTLCACAESLASDYRAEARAFTARARNDGPDGKSYGLQGTYYFGEVGIDGVPLGEAAFLGRESMMSLSGQRAGISGDYSDTWYLDTEIYIPTAIPLFITAGVARFETLRYDPDTFEPREGHDTAWDAGIGVTPLDGLRITTRFREHGGYDPNVDVKYVGAAGGRRWFGIGANLQEVEGHLYWGVAADFFPDRTLRLGAVYDDGYESLWLLAEKFFTSRASLTAAYATSDFLGEGFRLEAAWRF